MILTDQERDEIMRLVEEAESEPAETRVRLVNPPEQKDVSPALDGIARAVEGITGDQLAKAIKEAVDASAEKTAKAIKAVGLMIVDAIPEPEKPEKPEPPEKIDFSPVVEAMDRNTAVLERLIKVMGAPKTLIFDEADPTKPVGVAVGGYKK